MHATRSYRVTWFQQFPDSARFHAWRLRAVGCFYVTPYYRSALLDNAGSSGYAPQFMLLTGYHCAHGAFWTLATFSLRMARFGLLQATELLPGAWLVRTRPSNVAAGLVWVYHGFYCGLLARLQFMPPPPCSYGYLPLPVRGSTHRGLPATSRTSCVTWILRQRLYPSSALYGPWFSPYLYPLLAD